MSGGPAPVSQPARRNDLAIRLRTAGPAAPSACSPLLVGLDALAPRDGVNTVSQWPGLAVHRFSRPVRQPELARRAGIDPAPIGAGLSIGIVARTDRSHAAVSGQALPGRIGYLVAAHAAAPNVQIVQASPRHPILYCTLPIDPHLVRGMSASMRPFGAVPARPGGGGFAVSIVDEELAHSAAQFLGAIATGCDRRVLAPIRMQELVYRLLQGEQRTQLLDLANHAVRGNPVGAAVGHIAGHLAEPLTVATLAAQVSLSASAFSRVFRQTTGRSPYRYVKESRLDRARGLLDERRLGVSAVAGAVGYASVSHFIKEFRARFGCTPGEYAGMR